MIKHLPEALETPLGYQLVSHTAGPSASNSTPQREQLQQQLRSRMVSLTNRVTCPLNSKSFLLSLATSPLRWMSYKHAFNAKFQPLLRLKPLPQRHRKMPIVTAQVWRLNVMCNTNCSAFNSINAKHLRNYRFWSENHLLVPSQAQHLLHMLWHPSFAENGSSASASPARAPVNPKFPPYDGSYDPYAWFLKFDVLSGAK